MNRSEKPQFLFLEPFFGGSHRDVAQGLVAHSRYDIELVTLPARFWKWRMRGAALYFARKVKDPQRFSGLIVSDLMSLSDLKALWGPTCPPALVYFHENQLSYPLAPGEVMDYQFGFTDITTALSARTLLFNSETHCRAFFDHLPRFIRMMPEFHPDWVVAAIRPKAAVAWPGCHFDDGKRPVPPLASGPPLIIWNHRWEFDKDPDVFFAALAAVEEIGLDFRLAVLGENYQKQPKAFLAGRDRFASRIVQFGFVPSRAAYYDWLTRGAIVVSTARQENFGIAAVEAMRHGCLPLLPNRLSYPEILPPDFHADHLYGNTDDLVAKLAALIRKAPEQTARRQAISDAMARYAWSNRIADFDQALEELVAGNRDRQRPTH